MIFAFPCVSRHYSNYSERNVFSDSMIKQNKKSTFIFVFYRICVAGNSTLDNVVTNANTAGATEKVNCQSPRHPVGPSTPDIVNSRGFPGELDSNSDKQTGNPQQMHQRKMETTNYATSPHSNDR